MVAVLRRLGLVDGISGVLLSIHKVNKQKHCIQYFVDQTPFFADGQAISRPVSEIVRLALAVYQQVLAHFTSDLVTKAVGHYRQCKEYGR